MFSVVSKLALLKLWRRGREREGRWEHVDKEREGRNDHSPDSDPPRSRTLLLCALPPSILSQDQYLQG